MSYTITLVMEDFVGSLTDKERIELLKTIIDSYDCVTLKVNGEEDSIDGSCFSLDRKFQNNLILKG